MIFHNLDLKLILKKLYLKLETNHDKNNVYLDDHLVLKGRHLSPGPAQFLKAD